MHTTIVVLNTTIVVLNTTIVVFILWYTFCTISSMVNRCDVFRKKKFLFLEVTFRKKISKKSVYRKTLSLSEKNTKS